MVQKLNVNGEMSRKSPEERAREQPCVRGQRTEKAGMVGTSSGVVRIVRVRVRGERGRRWAQRLFLCFDLDFDFDDDECFFFFLAVNSGGSFATSCTTATRTAATVDATDVSQILLGRWETHWLSGLGIPSCRLL